MNRYRDSALAGMGVAIFLTLAGCGGEETAEAAPDAPAVVLEAADVGSATRAEIGGGVTLTGSLQPYRVVSVKAQVPGTLTGLRVDRGDAVRQGQVIATIEAEGIRGQAAGARAGVAAAEANLALSRQRLESARTLFEAGAMSELDFRAAQAGYEAARAQLAAAQAQASGAGEQARRATVTAPIAGEVSDRQVDQGEAVSPGQALFTVVGTEFLELAGQVPVDQAARVRPGQPAEFRLDAYPGRVFRGTVVRMDPTADPQTRQVGVYLRLPNPDRGLVGGLFATGSVQAGGSASSVVVPAAAIRGAGAGSYVWMIENGTAVRRAVVTGARDEARGLVAVTEGLRGGERVVVAPGELQEGARVRVAGDPAPAPATAQGGAR